MRTDRMVVVFLLGVLVALPFTVTAERSTTRDVTMVFPEREHRVSTSAETVGELLNETNIKSRNYDRTFPASSSRIVDGLSVFVYPNKKNVSEKEEAERTSSRTRTIYTSALPEDRRLAVRGSPGGSKVRLDTFKDTTSRIVYQGGADYKADQVDDLVEEGTMAMLGTGYSSHPKSTAPFDDGVTALGMPAGYGVVAVDPQVIPLGTRLYVEGYGYAIAADVGGGINGRQIDLCFDSHRDALHFGRQWVKVHILG